MSDPESHDSDQHAPEPRDSNRREHAEHETSARDSEPHSGRQSGDGSTSDPGRGEEASHEAHVRYERRDISLRWILSLIAAATCLIIVQLVVTWWLLQTDRMRQEALMKSQYPVAPAPSTRLPPEPRLEPLDRFAGVESSNVYLRLEEKERLLHRYGRTEQPGFVHVPIEQAMKLSADELPVRAQPSTSQRRKDNGLLGWGEANSGRVFRENREKMK
jgi:hypothetical protein